MLVKSRMSTYPLTIGPDESLSDAHNYMDEQKVRHLPVVKSDDKMLGLIAEDDLLKAEGGNKAAGTRVRKQMQDIKAAAQDVRKKILEVRSAG